MSPETYANIEEAVAAIRARAPEAPEVGVVLGSGLGSWADTLDGAVKLPYAEIPHMPTSTVVGHAGNLVLGRVPGGTTRVACLQGRVHTYEGHELDRIVFAVRVLAKLGCSAVLLTNAAGGIKRGFAQGDLMLIRDHLNLLGQNPLVGPNESRLGPRFPDMTEAYDLALCELAREAAREAGISIQEGVYAALLGPTYETPAEIEMLRRFGADAVGMSTVPEVIALRHMGVPCGAVSCITNLAAGLSPTKLDHAEVEATAKSSRSRFIALLSGWAEKTGAWARAAGRSAS